MDVVVTGASGLVGSALVRALAHAGQRPIRLVRGEASDAATSEGEVLRWDPEGGTIDARGLDGVGAVVHLAGAGIGERRWTREQKQRILESRVQGTTLVARTLAGLAHPPSVLVSGSAVGWYGGTRGDEVLDEDSPPPAQPDFLADVCRQWEAATTPAEAAGIRTVHLRSGMVLSGEAGALARMVGPFRLGLGGRIGSGRQYVSWIDIEDEVGAILHALTHAELSGPMNATAPNPVTNAELTRTLGRVLGRPAVLPTPLPALRVLYGAELVRHLLREGQRVVPTRLLRSGYTFRQPLLEDALRRVLSRPATS